MSRYYSTGVSRGGEPYDAAEPEFSDDGDDHRAEFGDEGDGYRDDGDDYDAVIPPDSDRWRWVAAGAGAVLLMAVVGTIVIVTGSDSASTTARVVPSESRPVFTPPPPKPPSASLPPETVTTLTPSTTASTSTAEAAPPTETAAPPPPPEADSRTVVYTVSGTKQPLDPVTVTYTDETGALRTDFDVTLPWTKTLVRSQNVLVDSLTAVSLASHLNCTITDGNGQTLVSQDYNTIATTCDR